MKEKTFSAQLESIDAVTDFVNCELEQHHCPMNAQVQIDVAIDEIFSNITHYAYGNESGTADVCVEIEEDPIRVILTFLDSGTPFNPLEKADPDPTLPAKERTPGGLGIFLVKKTMDAIDYRYENGRNILTLKKNFHQ